MFSDDPWSDCLTQPIRDPGEFDDESPPERPIGRLFDGEDVGHDARSACLSRPIRDVEEAVASFSRAGFDVRFERIQDRSAFSFDLSAFPVGAVQLVRTVWGTDSLSRLETPGHVAVIVNPTSAAPSVFTTAGNSVPTSATESPIMQPGREARVLRRAESPLIVVVADIKDLERRFEEITGIDGGRLEFASGLTHESPEGRRLQRTLHFAIGELRVNPSAVDSPIVRRQLDDFLLGGMLSLPGERHRLLDRSTASVGSALVRRAEEFMEANVGNPIGMSDVAAACDCLRTKLFQAFKRERRWTPLQFLVRRRMERARRQLQAPVQGVTVTKVSLDCGYANLSRFTQEYRKLFGETPSMTLHLRR